MADSLRFACLCSRPRVVILDESTSALDLENEVRVYDLLLQLGVTVISVGNRPSLVAFHDRILRMMGDGEWQMEEPQWKIDQAR
jgi:putative ATP-binding cassette transporter